MILLSWKRVYYSCETETKYTEKIGSFTRKEFGCNSFKRSFSVPETVSADKMANIKMESWWSSSQKTEVCLNLKSNFDKVN